MGQKETEKDVSGWENYVNKYTKGYKVVSPIETKIEVLNNLIVVIISIYIKSCCTEYYMSIISQ